MIFLSDGLPAPQTATSNNPTTIIDGVLAIKALETAQRLAEVRGVPYGELEGTVEENAARVFGW